MGRSLTVVTQPKEAIWKNEGYSEPPIWEYLSLNGANTWRAVYGSADSVNPLELTTLGQMAGTRTRGWLRSSDEAQQSGFWLGNSATTNGVTTNAWNPSTGLWGITNFGNTATCAHWYSSTREYGFIGGADAANVMLVSTPVILPAVENQNFEFITNGYQVAIHPLGASWAVHVGSTALPSVDLSALAGFTPGSNQQATNHGMACYNARSGVYAALYRLGTSGSTYRLHLFPVGKRLRKSTTHAELLAAFQASMAGYKFVDITLSGVTNTNTQADRYAHKLVLCDDHTLWIVVNDTNNSTSGGQGLRVFRVTSSVMGDMAAQTLTQYVQSATHAAHYGAGGGAYYDTRFMASYDNSVMAVYTHHYYYCAGAVGRFLPTDSVLNERIGCRGFSYADTSYGYGIAPAGGSSFVISSGHNKDSASNNLWVLDPATSPLAATGVDTTTRGVQGAYPQYASSTIYQGQVVNKIQQLDRLKP